MNHAELKAALWSKIRGSTVDLNNLWFETPDGKDVDIYELSPSLVKAVLAELFDEEKILHAEPYNWGDFDYEVTGAGGSRNNPWRASST